MRANQGTAHPKPPLRADQLEPAADGFVHRAGLVHDIGRVAVPTAPASSIAGDDGRGGDPDDRGHGLIAAEPFDVVVVGAGPAGVVAALRAARLGARTALITRDQFGGMAANDGPVPVRTLAQAARLIREARQLPLYGIAGSEPSLDYARLLARVRDVTADARQHTLLREDLEQAGVRIYEQAGPARFGPTRTRSKATTRRGFRRARSSSSPGGPRGRWPFPAPA